MLALLAVAIAAPPAAFNDAPTRDQTTFFESKIRPVLIDHCYTCHASDKGKVKGGLDLSTRDGVRAGGNTGPVILPGEPDESSLIRAVRHVDKESAMPPKAKLPAAVIEDLTAWVKAGRPDPRAGEAKPQKHEIDIEAGRKFWSFQPPKSVSPKVADAAWNTNFVDQFVKAALDGNILKPVADADKRTLARRLYLDITGLPPTPSESDAFAADTSPDAVAKLIDKLLSSPAFGERWGRHWLDVARYAESTGKSVNFNFPNAWRYRDYVIAAYNADKPFDRFVKEQLAGDLLPAKSDAEKAENLIATGFLAIGTKSLNERNRLQFELDVVDEQIDAFSQAFLGITAACARCHDHKFDPIPTKDYYALAGIFRSTETCYGTVRFVQANHPSSLISLPPQSVPATLPPLSAKERESLEKQISALQKEVADANDPIKRIRPAAQLSIAKAKLDAYEQDGTPKAQAMGAKDRFRPSNSPVFTRGEPDKPAGPPVPRGVLQVVSEKQPNIRTGSGRKELAEWVAAKDNPLTARVYVNRVWLHLFGRGLVSSPDNFGTTGTPPSNQALLDALAVWFADNGWSTKKLIRMLVTTHTYRLGTNYDAANFTADPDNALCWRMTPGRLDAEAIRDSVLAVSGNLTLKPPVGSAIAQAGEGPSQRPQLFSAVRPDANDPHRAVYLPIVRDNLPEMLGLFDGADASLVTGDRANTTVPSQALFLMNSPFVMRASDAAAAKVYDAGTTDAARMKYAYKLFFGRPATDAELERAESFLAKYKAAAKGRSTREAWAALCQAMFGSTEFLMRN